MVPTPTGRRGDLLGPELLLRMPSGHGGVGTSPGELPIDQNDARRAPRLSIGRRVHRLGVEEAGRKVETSGPACGTAIGFFACGRSVLHRLARDRDVSADS